MKISYITAQIPWGQPEAFILEELLEIKRLGIDLLIIPRNPPNYIFHKEAENLIDRSIWLPLINGKIIINFFYNLITKPLLWRVIIHIFRYSRDLHILVKNLATIPKGIYISDILKKNKIKHVHAHWGGTTATMGYVISQITTIPWSITLHRWDIYENNLLREKIKTTLFVRCISEKGKDDLIRIVGSDLAHKIKKIHMGVKIPKLSKEFIIRKFEDWNDPKKVFNIIVPGNLFHVKGHKYLIRACKILNQEGFLQYKITFYGKGPLKKPLKAIIEKGNLTQHIRIYGPIPHEELLNLYEDRKVDMIILPSINTDIGEHEGIPVSLMEAMAYGIPVISTYSGSIAELLSDGSGILIKEKSSEELAKAILRLASNKNIAIEIAIKGYESVCKEFNTSKNTQVLLNEVLENGNKTKSFSNCIYHNSLPE